MALNRRANRLGFTLLPGELESAMLAGSTSASRGRIAPLLGTGAPTAKEELTTWLLNNKGPWLRALIGEQIPLRQIEGPLSEALIRWIAGVTSSRRARQLVNSLN